MNNQINWNKECETIAAAKVGEVCRKFAANEEISLYMSRNISKGAVRGLLEEKLLHDKWNTIWITYCIIDRKDIVLDKDVLYQAALQGALRLIPKKDEEICDIAECRISISNWVEWEIGRVLSDIFAEVARNNPDKYQKYHTHSHAGKLNLDDISEQNDGELP